MKKCFCSNLSISETQKKNISLDIVPIFTFPLFFSFQHFQSESEYKFSHVPCDLPGRNFLCSLFFLLFVASVMKLFTLLRMFFNVNVSIGDVYEWREVSSALWTFFQAWKLLPNQRASTVRHTIRWARQFILWNLIYLVEIIKNHSTEVGKLLRLGWFLLKCKKLLLKLF